MCGIAGILGEGPADLLRERVEVLELPPPDEDSSSDAVLTDRQLFRRVILRIVSSARVLVWPRCELRAARRRGGLPRIRAGLRGQRNGPRNGPAGSIK